MSWQSVRLGDVCREITVGFVGKMANEYVHQGVPFLRSQDVLPFRIETENLKQISASFHNRISKSRLRPGDVVVVRTGYPGTASVVPASLADANCADLVIVRPSASLNPHFAACLFNSQVGRAAVAGVLVGSAQQHFNVGAAKVMRVLLPPIKEQDRIASILSAYDDLIEVNRRRVAVLEEMARRLFDEWFVHLRFPGHDTTPIQDALDGPLPEGWTMGVVGNLLTLHRGYDLSTTNRHPGTIPVMTGSGHNGTHDTAKITGPGVVTGRSGTVGQVFLVHEDFWPLNTALYVSEYKDTTPAFALFLLRGLNLQTYATGSAVPTLNRNHVHMLPALKPPADLIWKFDELATPMLENARVLKKQNETLAAARDFLLPCLLSGQLSVQTAPLPLAAE